MSHSFFKKSGAVALVSQRWKSTAPFWPLELLKNQRAAPGAYEHQAKLTAAGKPERKPATVFPQPRQWRAGEMV